ncbi:hypothetical protein NADFUDRAFT_84145 [Nadsonia fulvescens var. elongata DSM 6958]|uniref:Uncharacterized protein n=1 Tax=Nadsonia fulvescens var. elongata DSM 6958 TaxID=857566 RepID=A0A1E3PET8_9ASCO|nr:hypothetical protein NADFUDRAFT_84145 [Nadsonia fulvescens var. elongata DSM 6958]
MNKWLKRYSYVCRWKTLEHISQHKMKPLNTSWLKKEKAMKAELKMSKFEVQISHHILRYHAD